MGMYTLLAQVVFLREILVICGGNELIIGVILGVWLGGIAAGANSGSKIKKRGYISFLLVMHTALFPILLLLLREVRGILNLSIGELVGFRELLVISIISVLPFSFITGLLFPLFSKEFKSGGASVIGMLYFWESTGGLMGGLLFTFLLVNLISPLEIALAIAILGAILAGLLEIKKRPHFSLLYFFITIILALYLMEGKHIEQLSIKARWLTIAPSIWELIDSKDTHYQNIALGYHKGVFSLYNNGQWTSSFPDPYLYNPEVDLIMAQAKDPQKVLLIGSDVGILIQLLSQSNAKIDYLELDKEYISFLSSYLHTTKLKPWLDSRVKLIIDDGRRYLHTTRKSYELLFIGMPDPTTAMINRFYTCEFFAECKRVLTSHGVLVLKLHTGVDYLGPEMSSYLGSVYKSLKSMFPYVVVVPGTENFLFASKSSILTSNINQLFARLPEEKAYFLFNLFQQERVDFINNFLNTSYAPLNTDNQPVSYFYYLILWCKLSGADCLAKIFNKIKNLPFYIYTGMIIVILTFFYLFVNALPLGLQKNISIFYSLTSSAFLGMAMEVLLLFYFQNMFGSLYYKIGIIIALFMIGLSVGAIYSSRFLVFSKNPYAVFVKLELVASLFAFSIPLWISSFSPGEKWVELLIFFLVIIAGIFTGLELPLGSNFYIESKTSIARAAALVDTADHLGASFGAFLSGVFLLPLFGQNNTAYLLGIIKLLGVILWFRLLTIYKKDF